MSACCVVSGIRGGYIIPNADDDRTHDKAISIINSVSDLLVQGFLAGFSCSNLEQRNMLCAPSANGIYALRMLRKHLSRECNVKRVIMHVS